VEPPLPPLLESLAGWIACAGGAPSAHGYVDLLNEAGLVLQDREDHTPAIASLLGQIHRRLVLIRGSIRAGLVDLGSAGVHDEMLGLGEQLVAVSRTAVEEGGLGYGLFVARRPGARASARAPAVRAEGGLIRNSAIGSPLPASRPGGGAEPLPPRSA
jgi:hypothetical protein